MCDVAMAVSMAANVGSSMLSAKSKKEAGQAAASERMFGAQQSFSDAIRTRQDAFNIKLQTMKQEQTLDENMALADTASADARRRAPIDAESVYAEGGKVAGRQVAAISANGIELGFGSPLDVLADTAVATDVAARSVRRSGELEAREWQNKRRNLQREKEMVAMRGDQAMASGALAASNYEAAGRFGMQAAGSALRAGETSAMGVLLGGLGGVAEKWYTVGKK